MPAFILFLISAHFWWKDSWRDFMQKKICFVRVIQVLVYELAKGNAQVRRHGGYQKAGRWRRPAGCCESSAPGNGNQGSSARRNRKVIKVRGTCLKLLHKAESRLPHWHERQFWGRLFCLIDFHFFNLGRIRSLTGILWFISSPPSIDLKSEKNAILNRSVLYYIICRHYHFKQHIFWMSSLGDIFLSSMHHFCGILFRFDFKGRSQSPMLILRKAHNYAVFRGSFPAVQPIHYPLWIILSRI